MIQSSELQELKEVLLALENGHVRRVLDTLLKYEGELKATDVQTATINTAVGVFCKLVPAVISQRQYRPELLADILVLFESRIDASYRLFEKNKASNFKLYEGGKDERN